jgi:thymidine kinase
MAGKLEVITGPMFAGKTEELIRRAERERIAKKKVIILKPTIDTRYSKDKIASHNGKALDCHLLNCDFNFLELDPKLQIEILSADVVCIDEAQFFSEEIVTFCEWLAQGGKRVIVAGLNLDFKGEPFGPMPKLLALADDITSLTAVCTKCGKEATRTQRLIDGKPAPKDSPLILIGGLETYEARCRDCWQVPK